MQQQQPGRMRDWLRWAFVASALLCAPALGQLGPKEVSSGELGPKALSSPAVQGQVISARDGTPIEGAVVVLRWEWEAYRPPDWGSSGGFRPSVDDAHLAEAVSDAQGRFEMPAWGPVVRMNGRLTFDAPRVMAFKPGYAPFEASSRRKDLGAPIVVQLAPAPADAEAYAESIADFQSDSGFGGLRWKRQNDDWKRMPRMVMALYREKQRLGEAGRSVIGIPALHGRSGRGELHLPGAEAISESRMGGLPTPIVVAIVWQVRREDGTELRRFVQQVGLPLHSSSTSFQATPWRMPSIAPRGWRIDTDAKPIVRIYAPAYRTHPDTVWEEVGGSITMQPLAPGREALLAELRRWRRDIDDELARTDTLDGLEGQRLLAYALARECDRLTADVRVGICLDPASPLAAAARERPRDPPASTDAGRTRFDRELKTGSGSPIGMTQRSPAPPGPRKPVDGFRIVPVESGPARGAAR